MLMMILIIKPPISTGFYMQNNFWTKIAKNGNCDADRSKGNPKNMTLTIEGENPLFRVKI